MTRASGELYDIEQSAIEELRDWCVENPDDRRDHNERSERIFEIADGSVPVYTADILQCAADNPTEIGMRDNELGPAFGGEPTPVNVIATSIFEYITEKLWEAVDEICDELDEELEDAEED